MAIDDIFQPSIPKAWCVVEIENIWTIREFPVKKVDDEFYRGSHDYSTTEYFYQPNHGGWIKIPKDHLHTSKEEAAHFAIEKIDKLIGYVQDDLERKEMRLNELTKNIHLIWEESC